MYFFKNDLVLLWKAWVFGALFKLVQGTEDWRNIMRVKKVLRGHYYQFYASVFSRVISTIFITISIVTGIFHMISHSMFIKIDIRLKNWKKPNVGKTIITEMGYHPANDADNLVTRKLSASKPLELKASVLHTLLLTNGASVKKKVPKLAGFLSTT